MGYALAIALRAVRDPADEMREMGRPGEIGKAFDHSVGGRSGRFIRQRDRHFENALSGLTVKRRDQTEKRRVTSDWLRFWAGDRCYLSRSSASNR